MSDRFKVVPEAHIFLLDRDSRALLTRTGEEEPVRKGSHFFAYLSRMKVHSSLGADAQYLGRQHSGA